MSFPKFTTHFFCYRLAENAHNNRTTVQPTDSTHTGDMRSGLLHMVRYRPLIPRERVRRRTWQRSMGISRRTKMEAGLAITMIREGM